MRFLATTLFLVGSHLLAGSSARGLEFETNAFTSSGTANPTDDNYVFVPSQPASPARLLLFFPGSGSSLFQYTTFLQHAATRGYYVIGLAYRNEHSPAGLCGCMAACMGELEHQNVSGVDNGFYSADASAGITPALNSVNYRLHAFLDHLNAAHIGGGFDWSQFWYAPGDHPYWSRIVVAGHSGGGSMATWILKNSNAVAAIAFSAPSIILDADQPGPAMSGVTPYYVGGAKGTCSSWLNFAPPSWVTPGFGAHLMVYDDSRDTAYTGSWAGHDIPIVVNTIGGLTELLFSDGGTPSGRWITRTDDTTGCTGANPHHGEPVANCGLDHHGVWNYLLDKALTF
ncbi:MAG TPA: hypothetical protein VKE22_22055 [Haliangiales bacterium]|nr:hypothetical protein [Haliangiales bacterium]